MEATVEELSPQEQCAICLEPPPQKDHVIISCGHVFCRICINTWMASQNKGKTSCPLCRKPFVGSRKRPLSSGIDNDERILNEEENSQRRAMIHHRKAILTLERIIGAKRGEVESHRRAMEESGRKLDALLERRRGREPTPTAYRVDEPTHDEEEDEEFPHTITLEMLCDTCSPHILAYDTHRQDYLSKKWRDDAFRSTLNAPIPILCHTCVGKMTLAAMDYWKHKLNHGGDLNRIRAQAQVHAAMWRSRNEKHAPRRLETSRRRVPIILRSGRSISGNQVNPIQFLYNIMVHHVFHTHNECIYILSQNLGPPGDEEAMMKKRRSQ